MTDGVVDGFGDSPVLITIEGCLPGHTFVEVALDVGRYPSVDEWMG
jgi:hypothetical protein